MNIRWWAIVVALLYLAALVALTYPVLLASFFGEMTAHELAAVFVQPIYWIWIAIMVLSEVALLVVPVRVARGEKVTKRSVIYPAVASGLMMGAMVLAAIWAVYEFVWKDTFWDRAFGSRWGWPALAVGTAAWCAWGFVFFRAGRRLDPGDFVAKYCRTLLKGSVLELLVAVPTHVVARSRDYCCAGVLTFIGIAMGLSVMLLSFGPGVFFLYLDRWRRLHPSAGRPGNADAGGVE